MSGTTTPRSVSPLDIPLCSSCLPASGGSLSKPVLSRVEGEERHRNTPIRRQPIRCILNPNMKPPPPTLTLRLYPGERAALLDLLSSLAEEDWARPTVCPGWSVKDIAAHILGDDLGRLARGRDAYRPALFTMSDPATFEADLLVFVNRQNELWVDAARRFSPQLIIQLLTWSGEQTQAYFETLDQYALGRPVSWAGPEPAPVWLDIAREYTERWLHQQQLRDATNRPGLTDRDTFAPVLDTFIRALPHTFRDTDAPADSHVRLTITGLGEPLVYALIRAPGHWQLTADAPTPPNAAVTMPADTAWRLFTKGIPRDEARAKSQIAGEERLALKVFDTVSIIA